MCPDWKEEMPSGCILLEIDRHFWYTTNYENNTLEGQSVPLINSMIELKIIIRRIKMSPTKTRLVQVVKNQNNSSYLFDKWNEKNLKNIKCSNVDCTNDVKNNAYLVTPISDLNEKFILPLCQECYEKENNSRINTDLIDMGSVISVEESLLIKLLD